MSCGVATVHSTERGDCKTSHQDELHLPPRTAGSMLFFSADDGTHGGELWAMAVASQ